MTARSARLLANRFLQPPVPARRDAGEHPLQHDGGQLITCREVLIGSDRHLRLAVLGSHPRSCHPNAPAAERDLAIITAVAVRDPVGVVLTTWAADLLDLLSHQLLQHAEPDADAECKQSLLRCPDELPQRFLDAGRQRLLGPLDASFDLPARYGLHAVLLSSCRSSNSGDLDFEIALHAANGSGRGRENRHFKFYAKRDNLTITESPQL